MYEYINSCINMYISFLLSRRLFSQNKIHLKRGTDTCRLKVSMRCPQMALVIYQMPLEDTDRCHEMASIYQMPSDRNQATIRSLPVDGTRHRH